MSLQIKQLPFELEPDATDSPAVGLIVLQSDESMEHELRFWLPDAVRLFHSRIPNAVEISQHSLQRMKSELPEAVARLPDTTDFKVIVYGCTSGTTIIGEAVVEAAVQGIFPLAKVTNPLTAIKARLDSMGARRIALLTPYVPDVSAALVKELENSGFEVTRGASFHESRDNRVARISQRSLHNAFEYLAEPADIDAIVASCTNLRTYNLLQNPSTALPAPIPVISSNSALSWHIQSLLPRVGP